MTAITLSSDFFFGGNATFTVNNPQNTHYTFKIRQPRGENKPYFVSLLSGPNNENDYTYLGMVNPFDGSVKLTKASKMNDDSTPVKVIRWVLKHVYTDNQLPDGYTVQHEGKCGCCGRTLTVPESIARGIGPECWSRICGS